MRTINKKNNLLLILVLVSLNFINQSCDVEAEVFSEITPDQFFQNDAQIASAASAAYTPLYGYWQGLQVTQDLVTDQSTVPVRSNGGWDDGGVWPRLMAHDFNSLDITSGAWFLGSNGVANCNRLIEIFSENLGPDAPVVSELRALRAFYFYLMLSNYGNIPIETRFAEADPAPSQVTPIVAFDFLETELLASIDNITEDKSGTYAKVNKWVGYAILAKLYLNAERITGIPHYQEAADATEFIIDHGGYTLEGGYFANFKTENEGSSENMFVVPYDRNLAVGFDIRTTSLHQSAGPTFGFTGGPWGGFSFQEDFYNAFDDNDKRKGMFIIGQQYTIEAGPSFSDEFGFFYSNPNDNDKLIYCVEDWDNYAADPALQAEILGGCNIVITADYQLVGGKYLYRNGARAGKYQYELYENDFISVDLPIFRYADVLLMRSEALWRGNPGSPEALMLVNQIRDRAGLDPLGALTEDLLYWEYKKEMALEVQAREITIRFGHWEDDWFLRDGFKDEYRRIFPIPESQLQANPNLDQNFGYISN